SRASGALLGGASGWEIAGAGAVADAARRLGDVGDAAADAARRLREVGNAVADSAGRAGSGTVSWRVGADPGAGRHSHGGNTGMGDHARGSNTDTGDHTRDCD